MPNPERIHQRPRKWFPKKAKLEVGKLVPMKDSRGRRRLVRVIKIDDGVVVVDSNHRWAGQKVDMDVELVCILAGDGSTSLKP
jgi:FKBP-type peptidyl-prolyl cis-trans isomerase 2